MLKEKINVFNVGNIRIVQEILMVLIVLLENVKDAHQIPQYVIHLKVRFVKQVITNVVHVL